MKEQFCSYEISLKLKELGFNDECIGCFALCCGDESFIFSHKFRQNSKFTQHITAPLWQQAVDWLREKHNIMILQNCPIPPEAIKAAKGNLDNKSGFGFYLYNVNWNPRIPYSDVWEEDFYMGREQAILKALELIKK